MDCGDCTSLTYAAMEGHEGVARLLLEKGANSEYGDTKGYTPLIWAAKKGHERIFRLLVEKGANI